MWHRQRHPKWMLGLMKWRLRRKLKLEQHQVQQLDTLLQVLQEGHSDMHAMARESRQQLQTMLQNNELDSSRFQRWLAAPGKWLLDHSQTTAEALSEFAQCLQPQQRLILQQYLRQHHHAV